MYFGRDSGLPELTSLLGHVGTTMTDAEREVVLHRQIRTEAVFEIPQGVNRAASLLYAR
jgi:hypothetical protein